MWFFLGFGFEDIPFQGRLRPGIAPEIGPHPGPDSLL